MSLTYRVSELFVLHFNADNDRNGNPRRVLSVGLASSGTILASEDEGYSGVRGALNDLVLSAFWVDPNELREIVDTLIQRTSGRIPTTPSFRRDLLSVEKARRTEALIHGRPKLVRG